MEQVTYCDFDTQEGVDAYRRKAQSNLALFRDLFKTQPTKRSDCMMGPGANDDLMHRISMFSGIPFADVQGANCADETLNSMFGNFGTNFGCTAIARDGVIGQTLDLYSVDLCVVREKDALYVTMPPYLAMMGIGKKIACCINHLQGPVGIGTPVSHIRRDVLRTDSIDDVMHHLTLTRRTTCGNYLVSDGKEVMDTEVTPTTVSFHTSLPSEHGAFYCHTNHFVGHDIRLDKSCPRLARGVKLLRRGVPLVDILDDPGINLPIVYDGRKIGFGSLIRVIMDVKEGTLTYRDQWMKQYETRQL